MCVTMCRVLIWVIWEEIKAKYKVVADVAGRQQCWEYSKLVAQSSFFRLVFLDKTVSLNFNVLQCLIWVLKYSFNHTQKHKFSCVKVQPENQKMLKCGEKRGPFSFVHYPISPMCFYWHNCRCCCRPATLLCAAWSAQYIWRESPFPRVMIEKRNRADVYA